MTDPYTSAPSPEDIDEDGAIGSRRLSAEADSILAAGERDPIIVPERPLPLRSAVRQDISQGRDWARERSLAARDAVQAQPLKSTGIALGLGLLIGLLLS